MKSNKLKIILSSVLSIIIVAVIALFIVRYDIPYDIGGKGTGREPSSVKTTSSVEIYDELKVSKDEFVEDMSILVGTFKQKNTNTNKVTVFVNSKEVAEKTFSSAVLKDNDYYKIKGVNLNLKKGDTLKIQWTSADGTDSNSVSLYTIKGTSDSKLYIKDLSTGKTTVNDGKRLAVTFSKSETIFNFLPTKYYNNSPVLEWICVGVVAVLICVVLFLFLIPNNKTE